MTPEVVVVGSGPNGFAAAITFLKAGKSVLLVERNEQLGGGMRTESLTLEGFHHDVCSAVHPLAIASPVFQTFPLENFGLQWIFSPASVAHPLEQEGAILLKKSVEETAENLGEDCRGYIRVFKPLVDSFDEIFQDITHPLFTWPRNPKSFLTFGLKAIQSAKHLAQGLFQGERARCLFAGTAAHINTPLGRLGSSGIGLVLQAAGHARGWPIPKGGTQSLTRALEGYFLSLGGVIQKNFEIKKLEDLPSSEKIFFDLSPKQIGDLFSREKSFQFQKQFSDYKYGPGVFKMDWALSGPIPWKDRRCLEASTVHLGGSFAEILESEKFPSSGRVAERPFVLLVQPSLFDSTRAPHGKHTAWAYCHVPNGATGDFSHLIERQIERFAPGFKSVILARSILSPAQLESRNPNLVGGDISGGAVSLGSLFFRPWVRVNPYKISGRFWICSSSTYPGPGVHGMCGYNAALKAISEGK